MSCLCTFISNAPSPGDTEQVLLQKIAASLFAGGGSGAGVSSISLNGGLAQTGAVSINTGGTVTSVNGDPGPAVSLDSGEIPEGANLYFTEARTRATLLTGLVATAGVVAATDSILQAFGKVAGVTNDLLNFRDTNSHADASIYINSGATEIIKVIGSTTFVQLNTSRIQRDVTSDKLGLLSGTSKGTGAFFEAYGDTHATTPGLAMIVTKGRAPGQVNFQIFNNALGSSSGDIRAGMSWEGDWAFSPTWNDAASTFTALDLNVTNTLSNAASLLMNLRVAAVSQFKVSLGGTITNLGGINAATGNFVVATNGNTTVIGNIIVGSNLFTVDGSNGAITTKKYLQLTNSTALAADPTTAGSLWATAGEIQYRTSGASEGSGQTNRLHNRAELVVGVGTDYTLTASAADVVFGTTSPVVVLPTAGVYLVMSSVQYLSDGAGAADVVPVQLWNQTDASGAGLGGSKVMTAAAGLTSESALLQAVVTITATKTFTIRASNSTSARGTIISTRTNISYVRLS